jgi:hypothetical protein
VLDPLSARAAHPGRAGAADLRSATVMLVVRGDVPDRRLPGSSWNFDGDPTGIVMVRR